MAKIFNFWSWYKVKNSLHTTRENFKYHFIELKDLNSFAIVNNQKTNTPNSKNLTYSKMGFWGFGEIGRAHV